MTMMKTLLGAAATLALTAGVAAAEPAIIFDLGGKFDKSFNEAAFNGAQRWAQETGGTFKELEMQSEAQREQALRRLMVGGDVVVHEEHVPARLGQDVGDGLLRGAASPGRPEVRADRAVLAGIPASPAVLEEREGKIVPREELAPRE